MMFLKDTYKESEGILNNVEKYRKKGNIISLYINS